MYVCIHKKQQQQKIVLHRFWPIHKSKENSEQLTENHSWCCICALRIYVTDFRVMGRWLQCLLFQSLPSNAFCHQIIYWRHTSALKLCFTLWCFSDVILLEPIAIVKTERKRNISIKTIHSEWSELPKTNWTTFYEMNSGCFLLLVSHLVNMQ